MWIDGFCVDTFQVGLSAPHRKQKLESPQSSHEACFVPTGTRRYTCDLVSRAGEIGQHL